VGHIAAFFGMSLSISLQLLMNISHDVMMMMMLIDTEFELG